MKLERGYIAFSIEEKYEPKNKKTKRKPKQGNGAGHIWCMSPWRSCATTVLRHTKRHLQAGEELLLGLDLG